MNEWRGKRLDVCVKVVQGVGKNLNSSWELRELAKRSMGEKIDSRSRSNGNVLCSQSLREERERERERERYL